MSDVTDEEVIDGEVEEIDNLPAVRSTGMLLAGTDAKAKLEYAMEIAMALSDVIEKQKLFANISGKKHVLVEGWELLGSLLGVFPVVEWTRETANGWEARVVAKTLDGSEVGSAEMMCTRDENRWKSADDYAIRSMAQTRAVSKSLRAPLGFVMKLAGYEPTPEAEALPTAPAEPKPFDPNTDLLPGAISGRDAPKRLAAALDGFDPTVDWQEFLASVTIGAYDANSWRDLNAKDTSDFWRRLSNAAQWLSDHTPAGDFPPVDESMIIAAFVFAFGEDAVDTTPIPRKEIPTPEVVEKEEEEAPLTEEQIAKIEAAMADPSDDPAFGYENPKD